MPPLSLSYLAGALLDSGHEVEILDLLTSKAANNKVIQKLKQFQPDMVGTTGATMVFPAAARILQICKEFDNTIVTVMGGPHVSFAIEDTFRRTPWVDIIVVGEGDETVVDLVGALEHGKSLDQVKGIAYTNDETIIRTAPRSLIQDLNKLPMPARHLLPLSKYQALETACSIISSRGCPYSCIFCSAPKMFGRKVRFRRPALVADEIEMVYRELGFKRINLVDDTFTLNHDHARELCREILRRRLPIEWTAYSRVDTLNAELLDLMRNAGCTFLVFGVESGSQQIMDNIKKGITVDKVRNAVKLTVAAGIGSFASFILGLPGETPSTARTSLALAREMFEAYGVQYGFHFLSPFPGTEVYDEAEKLGIRITTSNWASYNANKAITKISPECDKTVKNIVTDYDDAIKKAWGKIEEWADEGDPVSIESLRRRQSTDFVWKLLKGDLVECASRQMNGNGSLGPAREELVRILSEKTQLPLQLVQNEVLQLCDKGYLKTHEFKKRLGWHWA